MDADLRVAMRVVAQIINSVLIMVLVLRERRLRDRIERLEGK